MKPTFNTYFSWPLLVIAGLFLLIYPSIFDAKLDLGGDNAGYYILGKSLAEGRGYTNIHFYPETPANHFPPGYPMLLAVFMWMGIGITGLKVVNGILLLASAFLLYRFFLAGTDRKALALIAVLLLITNIHVLRYATILMSEVPFLFFATLVLVGFRHTLREDVPVWKNPWFWGILLASVAAYHIRTAGLALIAGTALAFVMHRKWKAAVLYSVGFVALSLPWFLRGQSLGGSSYLSQLFAVNPYRPEMGTMGPADWVNRFGANVVRYISMEIPNGLLPYLKIISYQEPAPLSLWIAGLLIVALAVFGWFNLKAHKPLLLGYLAGSFGILFLWPEVWFGPRFVLPILPVLGYLALVGGDALLTRIANRYKLLRPSAWIWLVVVFLTVPTIKELHAKAQQMPESKYRNFFEAGQWVNENLPANAVVANRKPALFYLYANRYVAGLPSEVNYERLLEIMENGGVTHVIIDQLGYASTGRYLVPVVQAEPEKFKVLKMFPNPETYILEFNPNLGYQGAYTDADPDNNLPGKRQGEGTFTYPDGRVFSGFWDNGLRNGPGKLTLNGGKTLEGTWKNDSLQQPARIRNEAGEIEFEGTIGESGISP